MTARAPSCTPVDLIFCVDIASHSVTAASQRRQADCTGICEPLTAGLARRLRKRVASKHLPPHSPNHGSVFHLLLSKVVATTVKVNCQPLCSRKHSDASFISAIYRQYLAAMHIELSKSTFKADRILAQKCRHRRTIQCCCSWKSRHPQSCEQTSNDVAAPQASIRMLL